MQYQGLKGAVEKQRLNNGGHFNNNTKTHQSKN